MSISFSQRGINLISLTEDEKPSQALSWRILNLPRFSGIIGLIACCHISKEESAWEAPTEIRTTYGLERR